jgi:hypothetical protein
MEKQTLGVCRHANPPQFLISGSDPRSPSMTLRPAVTALLIVRVQYLRSQELWAALQHFAVFASRMGLRRVYYGILILPMCGLGSIPEDSNLCGKVFVMNFVAHGSTHCLAKREACH